MNTMGCSFLLLAMAALVVGFIPILTWITLIIALPLSVIGLIASGNVARKPSAQQADKAVFLLAIMLSATILFRLFVIS